MTDTTTPTQQLAALIGDDNAHNAIQAGWDAIRHPETGNPNPTPFEQDYVARILAAATAAIQRPNDMYIRAYLDVTEVLDEAIGTNEDDGAGMGLAQDVRLLAQRYKDLRTAVLALKPNRPWSEIIAEIEASPLRCPHGVPVDDDCRYCIADVMAEVAQKNAEVKP